MKKIIIICLFVFTFSSCSKEDDNLNSNLIGTWNWIGSSGGIDGITETPESTGNQIILKISSDTIKNYINEDLKFISEYKIEIKESNIYNDNRRTIILENAPNKIIEITGDKLILIDDCNDCYMNEYIKAN